MCRIRGAGASSAILLWGSGGAAGTLITARKYMFGWKKEAEWEKAK
jgi:hypothetical protein